MKHASRDTAVALDTAAIRAVEDTYQVPTYAKLPLALVRGEGCYVEDADGKRYLDLYGGHCVALTGHCHPRVVEAIREQAGRLLFYSNVVYNDVRAVAAERVAQLAPQGLRRVFFCNSGTEANETALKIARRATGRRHVISMADGFHGRTLGALGVTGASKYKHPTYPVPTEHVHVPYGDLDAVVAALRAQPVAAVMLEPIPSMGGIRVAPDAYFHGLARACADAGALLIFDEVQTGFGRTGRPFFAHLFADATVSGADGEDPEAAGAHAGATGDPGRAADAAGAAHAAGTAHTPGAAHAVHPDLITGAKGLASGFPAGVVFVREDIAAAIGPGEHGTTFGGGPLASAAMAATAAVLVDEDLAANAARVGAFLQQQVSAIPGVRSVTGRGLLLGINLERPARPVVKALREDHGILTGGADDPQQIRLLAPLVLTENQAATLVPALTAVLSSAASRPEVGAAP